VNVKVRALHGGEPAITPLDSPGVRAAVIALEKGFGKKPLYQREGGSIPIVVQFKKISDWNTVLLDLDFRTRTRMPPMSTSCSTTSSAGSGQQFTFTTNSPALEVFSRAVGVRCSLELRAGKAPSFDGSPRCALCGI